MKKSVAIICLILGSNAFAQSSIMRGEISPGSYGNIKTDTNGAIYTTSNPVNGTLTDRSGSITTGGTAQTLAPVNTTRKYLLIQNNSAGTLWINFTVTAVQSQPSIQLLTNASIVMESRFVSSELVSIIGATTGQTFTAKEN